MYKVILATGALLLSTVAAAREIVLITPPICPIICSETDDRALSDNGVIEVLETALNDLGHHLVVEFDTGARSRVKTAMGMTDITLGAPFELKKNSRLEVIPTAIGTTPVMVVTHPDRPVDLNNMKDLMNYRLLWSEWIQVEDRFKPLFNALKAQDKLVILPAYNFENNALRNIHNDKADIMLISEARYRDGLRRLHYTLPEAKFVATPSKRMPGYDINLAFSSKSKLTQQERQHIIKAMQGFSPQGSAPDVSPAQDRQAAGLAQLMQALQTGQQLPPQALAKIKQIPAAMLEQIGLMQNLSPEMLNKLKQLHAGLQ